MNIEAADLKPPGQKKRKILLGLLPYWTPMIPPMGIASLKSFLQRYHYEVKILDANIQLEAREMYTRYFEKLKEDIPGEKRSNFFSIGHHVLRNHMMAHMHHTDEKEYISLVKELIFKIYYINVAEHLVYGLVEIIAGFYRWLDDYFMNIIAKEKPDILGLSVFRDTLPASMYVFKTTRERYPRIKTVMGGPIFSEQFIVGSPDLEFFLERTTNYIDKIIIGQGEKMFLAYLEGKLPGRRVYTPADMAGEILEFPDMDLPDYTGIDTHVYPFVGVTGSNGCEFQCSFCNVLEYFGKYRKKDPAGLVEEMVRLSGIYGNKLFYMTDHMLNPIISGLAEEFIRANVSSLYWTGYMRVDKPGCDRANTLRWRKGGFYCARLGVESGSQRVLDLIGKKITPHQSKLMISALASAGIKTTTYWFVGHPGETEEDFRQTLALLEELRDDIYEAESDYFNYHYSGQTDSHNWADKRKPVFPEKTRHMLIARTWIVDCQPTREEIFSRLNRFVQHCKKLGIPNPYTLNEIYRADERWQRLHKNAVPSFAALGKSSAGTGSMKHGIKPVYARNTQQKKDKGFVF